jgi:protein-L-isoaspartate O-methyltransferase
MQGVSKEKSQETKQTLISGRTDVSDMKTEKRHAEPWKKIKLAAMILVLVFAAVYVPAKYLAVTFTDKGANLYDEGRYEEAMVQFKRALRVYPGFRPARRQLAELEEYIKRYPKRPDVHFDPTPQAVVDKMLEMAEVKKNDLVYDLGCGDGRIVVTAAKRYGCKAVGYDIDRRRVEESLENVRRNGVGHLVTIKQKDIFTLDLSKATVIALYLLPHLNVKLIPQLEKLKPGSRIVSHEFDMKGIKPDKMVTVTLKKDNSQHKVYLWTTPLKRTLDDPLTTRGLRLRRLMVDEPPVEENRESDY